MSMRPDSRPAAGQVGGALFYVKEEPLMDLLGLIVTIIFVLLLLAALFLPRLETQGDDET